MTENAPRLPPGCALVALRETGSTNDEAKDRARAGCPSCTVVWALAQTAGRGRQGNAWTSIPGNLFMTIVLRPRVEVALSGQLSFLAAVALSRALRPLLPAHADVALKWPNDLLLDGKKAAGILLEAELPGWVVIGIGVNITAAPPGAASLKALGVEGATAEQVLEALVREIMALYNDWEKNGFGAVRAEWLAQAANIGKTIAVRLPKETLSATFLGIDATGALQLELPDGIRRKVTSGEVFAG